MLLDRQLTYSLAQALAASGNSTDTVDFGSARNLGANGHMRPVIIVTAKGPNADNTLRAVLQGADDAAFTQGVVTLADTGTVANPAVGPLFVAVPNHKPKRYTRMVYTVAGTAPAYVVDAGLACGEQTSGILA